MNHASPLRRLLPGTLAVALVAACAGGGGDEAPAAVQEVQGECGTVFGADICTWGETMGTDVVAFGATIPIGVVENAPAEQEMVWPPVAAAILALPATVQAATGITQLTVYWEAHGHPPGPYLTPHFDFHFYGISQDDRNAIDCVDTTKPAELAAGYELPDADIPGIGMLVGICVPGMGMHSLPGAEVHSTEIFQKTMVVGYNHGQPIFIEPMITAATLNARQTFSVDVPTVPGWPTTAQYPASFAAEWDDAAQAYRFTFRLPAAAGSAAGAGAGGV